MKTALFILTVVLLSSCKMYRFQVYDMQDANNLKNEDIEVVYNFWAEKGNSGFAIHNLTDKPIFVDLSKTHSIINSEANTFYQGKSWTKKFDQKTITTNAAGLKDIISISREETVQQPKVAEIPANSYKVFEGFEMHGPYILDGFDHKKSGSKQFSNSNTPVMVKNIISYSFDGKNERTFENITWAKSVEVMKKLPSTDANKFYVTYIPISNLTNTKTGIIK